MSIRWTPNGRLDVSTDPQDLSEMQSGEHLLSGAMARCTNLSLDLQGMAVTRNGSARIALSAPGVSFLIENQGNRYELITTGAIHQNETSIGSGYTVGGWSAMAYSAFNAANTAVFALNGADRKRIEGSTVREWGIDAPTVIATITAGASTGLTGTYSVVYTYARKEALVVVCESNPSSPSTTSNLVNQSLSVSWTASTDPQVTHVRLYRTLGNGSDYYFDSEIAVGTTTHDTSVADSALGSSIEVNHDRPPATGSITIGPNFNGVSFIAQDNNLYYCLASRPEYWPAAYYIEVSPQQFPILALEYFSGSLWAATQTHIYQIYGTGPTSFFPIPIASVSGTQSHKCFRAVGGKGIIHLCSDGLYSFTSSGDTLISNMFTPIFRGETVGSMPGMDRSKMDKCWGEYLNGKFYFGYPSTSATYADNVIVFDFGREKEVHYQFPIEVESVGIDNSTLKLLAADSNGYVWTIDDPDQTMDNGASVAWEIETKEFSSLSKYFPRHARYDVDGIMTGEIVLDGNVVQSHSISERNIVRRLITPSCGERLSMRLTGSGTAKIYYAELL